MSNQTGSNRAHPGWRLLAFLLLFVLLAGLAGGALAQLGLAPPAELDSGALAGQAPLFLLLLGCAALANSLVRHTLGPCFFWKLDFPPGRALDHGASGAAGGILLAGLAGSILWGSGSVRFTIGSGPGAAHAAALTATLLLSAALEEILFRGVLLRLLDQGLGPRWALLFSALAFGGIHAARASSGLELALLSLITATLAGWLLGLAFIRSGALWAPIGLHAAWNLGLGLLMGLPVSGIRFERSVLAAQIGEPGWLTGGSYGPEGGLAGALAIVVGCLALLRYQRGTN